MTKKLMCWKKEGKSFWERPSMKKNIFRGKLGTDKLGVMTAWNEKKEEYSDYQYSVLISGGGGISSPNFKNRAEALKEARKYMKKHDKC